LNKLEKEAYKVILNNILYFATLQFAILFLINRT
jgi:hypothetical protein